MFDYNLINDVLYEYLEGARLDSFKFIKSLNNIILKNRIKHKEPIYSEKVDLEYSVEIAYKFFLYISEGYAEYFGKRLNDGTITFSENFEFGQSFYDLSSRRSVVQIPVTNSIHDSFVLVHEVLHDMNLNRGSYSDARMLFTETISLLGEFLYRDFLIKYNFLEKDNYKRLIQDFLNIRMISRQADFEIKLSEQFIQNGYVSTDFLKDLYSSYDNDIVASCIGSLIEYEQLNIDYDQRYIIAALLSCYMYDRIKSNHTRLYEFGDINEMINDVDFETIMDYIDLDYDEQNQEYFIFTDKTLNKLEKCYRKELNNL